MTLQLGDEDLLVETVREFINREVKPTVRDVEHDNQYPEAWIEQMKQIGIFGLAIPRSTAGRLSVRRAMSKYPRISRGSMSLAGAMGGNTVVAKLITHFGTETQKRKYLPAMASGETGPPWRSPIRQG